MLTNPVMFGWIPFVVALFMLVPPKQAVLWAFFLAWLFLPMAVYDVPKLPDYTKMSATAFGVLLGAMIFDFGRLATFRPRFIDLPIVMFAIVAPIGAALTNGPYLKLYDGLSEAMSFSTAWLLPYFIGRVYFTTLKDMKLLALCFLLGALVYVPICWFEARFSPQLHRWIYGFHQHHFVHSMRGGGYRPRGFMQSGLMTATWMCSAALIAWCMWVAKTPFQLGKYKVQAWWVVAVLGVTAIICKGLGALLLAIGGLGLLLLSRWVGTRAFMILLLCVVPIFVLTRTQGVWTGEAAVEFVKQVSPERAWSLEYRFNNDSILVVKAMQKPLFGWGGYGRNLVRDQWGSYAITDGMWILLLGKMGAVGLIGFVVALAMPTILFLKRYPPQTWFTPSIAPVAALATVLALYQIDCLFNAMENPVYFLIGGGMCTFLTSTFVRARHTRRVSAPGRNPDGSRILGEVSDGNDDVSLPAGAAPARSEVRPA